MYNLIIVLLDILAAIFQGYCLQYFYGSFLDTRWSNKYGSRYYIAVLWVILKLGMNVLIQTDYDGMQMAGKLTVTFVILTVISLLFYQAGAMTLFLAVTFLAVSEISFFLSYTVLQLGNNLFDLWIWCMNKGYFTSAGTFEIVIAGTALGLQILMYIVFGGLIYAALNTIVRQYREKNYIIHTTELLFIVTPGMAGLLICVLLRIIIVTIEDKTPQLLYDKYPLLILIVPSILVLSLLSIIYGIKLFQDMIYLNREKNSRIILENQVNTMQEHIGEMERIYAGIRSLKHDMKNQLSVVCQLVNHAGEKNSAELQSYLAELNQTFDRLEFQYQTGNAVVDAILNMKYHEMIRRIPDIKMNADGFLFPGSLKIQNYDIGIILCNAMDNAIEACEKLNRNMPEAECFIRVSSFQKGKMIFLEMENSFDGNIIHKKQAEFPATDKADKEAHGIGLYNIRSAAEKYHGAVDWTVKDKVFILSVMLKNESKE